MSKCAVHMQKMKMSALGGIQSHCQREHESRKNKDIDYERSSENVDFIKKQPINYQRAVKDRLSELNLKKAVRKDAVVYCSFIISSDKIFFEKMAQEYLNKIGNENGWNLKDFEIAMPKEYARLLKKGSEDFFLAATSFFKERYGEENIINATVHFDENTPHMHLGIVPVTSDGRLSAKDIFTPLELKQLQSEFAEKVGAKFDLERGIEGSENTHLDELAFKLKKEQEKLQNVSEKVREMEVKQYTLTKNCKDLEKHAESLNKKVLELKTDISTLDTQKRLYERIIEKLKEAYEKIVSFAKRNGISMEQLKQEATQRQAVEYIEKTGQREQFNKFCSTGLNLKKEIKRDKEID